MSANCTNSNGHHAGPILDAGIRRGVRAILLSAVVIALLCAAFPRGVYAQIGGAPGAPLAPLALPPPPPAATAPAPAPGAPAALSTISALPPLAPAPKIVTAATPQSTAGVFRCSCFGRGTGTSWMGTVQSSTFTLASQSAQGQCVAYHENVNPASPRINPPSFGFSSSGPYPAVNPFAAPGNVDNSPLANGLNGNVSNASIARASVASLCARCACN